MHNMDTINSISAFRIHIAPIGFEIDRVVIPAKKEKADKVWLLIHEKPAEEKAKRYIEKIKKRLKEINIEYEIKEHNRQDLFNVIRAAKEIIAEEEGNHIYVNLASGSKIQSIALMMTCMMYSEKKEIIPFYVEAENYTAPGEPLSNGVKEIFSLPKYKMQKPKRELILALNVIQEKGRISKNELSNIAAEKEIIKINSKENVNQVRLTSLQKNIIQPLEDIWNFIEIEKIGRTRWITLTQAGKNATKFLD